jgi:acyl-CoA reductase-like NAD-dependent aldehyde dehydrogenase
MPQPLGVIGIVVPWNYPLYLTVGPLVGALAAGNRAMIKLSEYTPRFAALFARLAQQTFAADEVAVINGDAEVASTFSALPFDHLLFTGSTQVGHHVMRAAAANLTPVTLELGGKSPAIVGPGADLERAVERILVGKLLNAGQTCIAPDYVLLPEGKREAFVEAARACAARLYPDLGGNPDYTTIISPRHFARLDGLVGDATRAGARVVPLSQSPSDPERRRLAPVLLLDVPADATVMREEIFGPVLPLVTYRTLEEAIDYINARPRPLALYLFEKNGGAIDRVMAQTVAGGVSINETLLHVAQEDLPFGGVGPSGMGAYHGEAGFETFSKLKPIFRQSGFNGAGLLKPPYGKRFETMIRLLLR